MKYKIPLWRSLVLRLLNVELRQRTSLETFENQTLLVTCNHQSHLDGIILCLALPIRMVFPVSNARAVDNPYIRTGLWIAQRLDLCEIVPMNSYHPFGLRKLLNHLKIGQSVTIFPQGQLTLPDENLPDKEGVNWLAKRTDAVIIKANLIGADDNRVFARAGTKLRPKIVLEL